MKIPPSRLEAHRGASGAYPENTMLAFAKAREAGALSIVCHYWPTAGLPYSMIARSDAPSPGTPRSTL